MASKSSSPADRARRLAAQELQRLERAGVTHLPKHRAITPVKASGGGDSATVPSPGTGAAVDRAAALAALAKKVAQCTLCAELAKTRTQTVFGDGSPHARLVFMGEAPGADEDQQGVPFVGAAGQLLNKIIEACGLKRSEVYILNTLKCRPPGNRAPLPTEAANCRPFLDAQLAILRPEIICCLGAVAAQNLLATTETIGRLRGRIIQWQGTKVLCTYHPAYVLRNNSPNSPARRAVWDDMKLVMAQLGIEING